MDSQSLLSLFMTLSRIDSPYQHETGLDEYDSAINHMATHPDAVCGNLYEAWIETNDRLILTTGT